jgi:hypothetical protein
LMLAVGYVLYVSLGRSGNICSVFR